MAVGAFIVVPMLDTPAAALALWLALYALAAARLTRLVTLDSIADRPREWIINTAGRHRITEPVGVLITCPWCAGVWVGAAITVAAVLWHGSPWLAYPVIGAALAQLAGMLTTEHA